MVRELVVMVGLPASGKSTLVRQYAEQGYVVASSDYYMEILALCYGQTYSDVFHDYAKEAEVAYKKMLDDALSLGRNVVVDRTNLTHKSRASILNKAPKGYFKTIVEVVCSDEDEHNRRLNSRPGVTIPPNVIQAMKARYQMISPSEGFDEYKIVETSSAQKKG